MRFLAPPSVKNGYRCPGPKAYAGSMRFVAEAILPGYLEALQRAVDDVVSRLPSNDTRQTLLRLRRRLGRGDPAGRFDSLQRLVTIGEVQGWLTDDEAITIRKLAYRCAFYIRRAEAEDGGNSL